MHCVLKSFSCLNAFPGFFVDINLFKANKERATEISKNNDNMVGMESSSSGVDDLADEDSNLMVKLKFLTYKVCIFIQNLLRIYLYKVIWWLYI